MSLEKAPPASSVSQAMGEEIVAQLPGAILRGQQGNLLEQFGSGFGQFLYGMIPLGFAIFAHTRPFLMALPESGNLLAQFGIGFGQLEAVKQSNLRRAWRSLDMRPPCVPRVGRLGCLVRRKGAPSGKWR